MKLGDGLHHIISEHTKDVIALVIVVSFCVALFMPEKVVSHQLMQLFAQIVISVISFYFGSKKYESSHNKL